MESECLEELNKLCQAIQQLSTDEIKKLGAVVEYARPETAAQVRQLAENLEQFDYAPGVQNVEEYGRYMIQKSGRFEYDENLCDYYDYARYGLERMECGGRTGRKEWICFLSWGTHTGRTDDGRPCGNLSAGAGLSNGWHDISQLFMKRSGSSVFVSLNCPHLGGAITEMSSHLDQASSAGKTEIVEVKCVIVSGFQRTEHLSFDDWEECKRRRL